jgi:hypothetical protein
VSSPAIAKRKAIADASVMQCFYVLVHGRLNWHTEPPSTDDLEAALPLGFFCHRYVLASGAHEAKSIAFQRIRKNLEEQTCWISDGLATLHLEAEEITIAPMHKLLKPDNKGQTFYETR